MVPDALGRIARARPIPRLARALDRRSSSTVSARARSRAHDDVGTSSSGDFSSIAEPRGAVWWVRDIDLRIHDNEALIAACQTARKHGGDVACVFAWSERDAARVGEAQRTWLVRALRSLDRDLRAKYGGGVSFHRGDGAEAVARAARAVGARTAHASRRYEPEASARDDADEIALDALGIELVRSKGYLLFEPSEIRVDVERERDYFGTLMPFVRAAEKRGEPGAPRPAPANARVVDLRADDGWWASSVDDLGVEPPSDRHVDWSKGIRAEWDISEAGARETWEQFAAIGLEKFESEHGRSDYASVSRLSPYLRFGMISPRTVYHALATKTLGANGELGKRVSRTFWHRMYRRELGYWELHYWPSLPHRSVRTHYENRSWASGPLSGA